MRACVHLVVLTTTVLACRPNPGFALQDDSGDDSSGRVGTSDTGADSTTSAELCEPARDLAYPICEPKFPLLPLADFNVAHSAIFPNNTTCGVFTTMRVRRDADTLQRCDTACDETCGAAAAMDVTFAAKIPLLAPLLPAQGTCAVMWHVSRMDPDPEADHPCTTAGFLLMDDTPARDLRVYVTFDADTPDPFADQPDAPLLMTDIGDLSGCDLGEADDCTTDFFTRNLHLSFGACELDNHQSEITTDLTVGGMNYTLELHSAYRCLVAKASTYRWWLRREF